VIDGILLILAYIFQNGMFQMKFNKEAVFSRPLVFIFKLCLMAGSNDFLSMDCPDLVEDGRHDSPSRTTSCFECLRFCRNNYLAHLRSRVLLEKLIFPQVVTKFPAFYGTIRFITLFRGARQFASCSFYEQNQTRPCTPPPPPIFLEDPYF
jgi:hypothetical protein